MRKLFIWLTIITLLIAGVAYWWYFLRIPSFPDLTPNNNTGSGNFVPIDRPSTPSAGDQTNTSTPATSPTPDSSSTINLPTLRQLSSTPVGGYGIVSTPGTTTIRWIDRGRGNVYEANMSSLNITTISNTLLPMVYDSWWNKDNTSFVAQYLDGSSDKISTVIANITKRPAPTSATSTKDAMKTEYELKGKVISGNISAITESPNKEKLLITTIEGDRAVGYLSNADGSGQKQLFVLPFTKFVVDWPKEDTISITTNADSSFDGYMYFVNTQNGTVKKILGNIKGLSTKTSSDAKYVIYSAGTTNAISTFVYNVSTGESSPVIFKTLAEKCIWSRTLVEDVYCGVSSTFSDGKYPEDWYRGTRSFVDNIWTLDAKTGEVRQVVDLLNQNNVVIDAYKMGISGNGQFLFFINKNDLSLWSLDLVRSN